MNIAFTSGSFVLNTSIETLAGQSISVGENATLTIPEDVTLTLAPTTTLVVNGTVTGDGTVVVNSFDQLKAILSTDITNIEIGSGITVTEALTIEKDIVMTGTENINVNGNLSLKAGTYDMNVYDYCAEGYTCKSNGDGTWTVSFGLVKNVTTGKLYADLADAVANAVDGDELLLLDNLAIKGVTVGYSTAVKLTINLGGYELSSTDWTLTAYRTGTELTLKNGTVHGNSAGGGTLRATYGGTLILGEDLTVTCGAQANAIVVDNGTLKVVDGATIEGGINCVNTVSTNNIVITGGMFNGDLSINDTTTCVITGGTFTQDVSEYVAMHCMAEQNAEGLYVVSRRPLVNFAGTTMQLGSNLSLNFYFNVADVIRDDYYAIVTDQNGNKTRIEYSDWDITRYGIFVPCANIASWQMTEIYTIQVFYANGEEFSNIRRDSVQSYSMRALAMDTISNIAKTTIVDMLNYGAAAQDWYRDGYNNTVNGVANDGTGYANELLSDAQKALATQTTKEPNDVFEQDEALVPYWDTTTVQIIGTMKPVFRFKNLPDDVSIYVTFVDFRGNTHEKTLSYSDLKVREEIYYFELDDLTIADINQVISMNITIIKADGTIIGNMQDSMGSYILRARDKYSDNVKLMALYDAILKFSDSSYKYFMG